MSEKAVRPMKFDDDKVIGFEIGDVFESSIGDKYVIVSPTVYRYDDEEVGYWVIFQNTEDKQFLVSDIQTLKDKFNEPYFENGCKYELHFLYNELDKLNESFK